MNKKTDKQILFERMNKVAGMPMNEDTRFDTFNSLNPSEDGVKKEKEKYYTDRGLNPDGSKPNAAQVVTKQKGLSESNFKAEDSYNRLLKASPETIRKFRIGGGNMAKKILGVINDELGKIGIDSSVGDDAYMDAVNIILDYVWKEIATDLGDKYGGMSPDSDPVNTDNWLY